MDLNQSQDTILTVHFPLAGIEAATIYGGQPARPTEAVGYARTTAEATNVRAFDFLDRCRGGSRPGLKKFVPTLPGDPTRIQYLGVLIDPQADALWGNYRSVFVPTDGSDPYYVYGGAPGPGFPGQPPQNPFPGPWPDDPVPGHRDPNTGNWDGPNVTPDPGVVVGGVRVRTGGSLVPPPPQQEDAFGWPCDQQLRRTLVLTETYAAPGFYADYAFWSANIYAAWNANTPNGWRGPDFPDPFDTTPKGLIVAPLVLGIFDITTGDPVVNEAAYTRLFDGITALYGSKLDTEGWYSTYPQPNTSEGASYSEDFFWGIPYASLEANGLPVLQEGGTHGRLALVVLAGTALETWADPFKYGTALNAQPSPDLFGPYYSLIDTLGPFPIGADEENWGVYRRNYIADLTAMWESLADEYDRIDILVLDLDLPAASEYPGSVIPENRAGAYATQAAYTGHDRARQVFGSLVDNAASYTELTMDYPVMGDSTVRPGQYEAYIDAILNWIGNLP